MKSISSQPSSFCRAQAAAAALWPAFLLLDVHLEHVSAPAVYEDDERRYPHVYGPIERHAVCRVRRVERAPDGTFIAIGEEAPEHLP